MAWSRNLANPFVLDASPSLLFNNLSSNERFMAYGRLSEVHLVDHTTTPPAATKLPYKDTFPIFQVKWVKVDNLNVLVIATSNGFQVWNSDGSRMLYFFSIASEVESSFDVQTFIRGIAGVPGSPGLCVGSSTGDIYVFQRSGDDFTKTKTLRGHSSAITSLGASPDHLVSGDDSGDLAVWSVHNDYSKECEFKGKGFPCTSVAIRGEVVVAGFVTGNIRLYRITTGGCALDIAAHSRCINSIDLHPNHALFVSAGEDTFVNVWSLPDFETKSSSEVELLCSSKVEDNLLTGVQFIPDGSERIAVAAYDTDTVSVFERT